MAHYAFIDDNGVVIDVIAGMDEAGNAQDWEQIYGAMRGMRCLRTSYNTHAGKHLSGGQPFRKNYAGIGFTYDANLDAFVPPKPHPSWVINELSCTWQPPVARPDDELPWQWDEASVSWVLPAAPPADELSDPELRALSERISQALS